MQWYIENNIDAIETIEQSVQMTKIIYSVVKSLIYKEKVLIIVEDHDDFKDKKVILHPNYFGDW